MRRSFSSISTSSDTSSRNGIDVERGEAGLAPVLGVERRDAHQAVHAALGGQQAVGVAAPHDEGGRQDAGLLARVTSSTSMSKPRRSAQRRYMRSSISAQSWASVPPAPAWISATASRVVVLAGEQRPQLELAEAGGRGRRRPRSSSAATESSPSSSLSS